MRVMGLVGGFGLGFLAAAALGRTGRAGSDYDVDVQPGEPLPLEHIAALARAYRPGRLIEVELEHEDGQAMYEVELIDPQGVEWELTFDAYTGELLADEREEESGGA